MFFKAFITDSPLLSFSGRCDTYLEKISIATNIKLYTRLYFENFDKKVVKVAIRKYKHMLENYLDEVIDNENSDKEAASDDHDDEDEDNDEEVVAEENEDEGKEDEE
jgi:phosphopantothenoylcysteine synthetase/decarboxylase